MARIREVEHALRILDLGKSSDAVYASMPFRGLDLLVEVMGRAKGEVELDIYSSMRTYQMEEKTFADLYDIAQRNPRIRYHGALGQRALADAFRLLS